MRDFKDLYIVERIVSEARSNDPKGPVKDLKFKVAWKGYPGQDTWEAWKDLRSLKEFRDFLSSHKNKSYRDLLKKLSTESEEDANRITIPMYFEEQRVPANQKQTSELTKRTREIDNEETPDNARRGDRERKKTQKAIEQDI